MATLTADRPFVQRSLLDPIEAPDVARTLPTRAPQPRPRPAQPAPPDRATDAPAEPAAAIAVERTLDDVVAGSWESLRAAHTADCLVCGAPVEPRWSAGAKPVGGICRSCRSELA